MPSIELVNLFFFSTTIQLSAILCVILLSPSLTRVFPFADLFWSHCCSQQVGAGSPFSEVFLLPAPCPHSPPLLLLCVIALVLIVVL
jgi:hypothetical protein